MSKRVLIVDDDRRNIFALNAVLTARRYQCMAAHSVAEALTLLGTNADIGVILMDIMMPGIDGYEATRMLTNDERYKHIPVVAVTARAMQADKERCLAAGATDYVAKPVDIDKLDGLLQRFLQE